MAKAQGEGSSGNVAELMAIGAGHDFWHPSEMHLLVAGHPGGVVAGS